MRGEHTSLYALGFWANVFCGEEPKKRVLCSAGLVALMSLSVVSAAEQGAGQHELRRFTVADDIELTHFASSEAAALAFSPGRKIFSALIQRGPPDPNPTSSFPFIFRDPDTPYFISPPAPAVNF